MVALRFKRRDGGGCKVNIDADYRTNRQSIINSAIGFRLPIFPGDCKLVAANLKGTPTDTSRDRVYRWGWQWRHNRNEFQSAGLHAPLGGKCPTIIDLAGRG